MHSRADFKGNQNCTTPSLPGLYHAEKGIPSFQAEKFHALTW